MYLNPTLLHRVQKLPNFMSRSTQLVDKLSFIGEYFDLMRSTIIYNQILVSVHTE